MQIKHEAHYSISLITVILVLMGKIVSNFLKLGNYYHHYNVNYIIIAYTVLTCDIY